MLKECVLNPGEICKDCGKCDFCDLNEEKVCDNCCRCLGDADYRGIEITEIILPETIKLRRKTPSQKKKNVFEQTRFLK